MPEIKIKHVVSFNSEDKVHKAENLVKPETYRKWKCATPGEKCATIVLQFEKATQISSIDIGNESSAFVEVLVGRSSDSVSDFQVLLVASSFMSPLESRNGTHTNRVRMFGPEKLSQNVKDEKWDCVQVICTQPFNKTISYGLSFIKFHSPGDKDEEQAKSLEKEKATKRLGAFKLRYEDDEDSLSIGSLFGKQKTQISDSPSSFAVNKTAPSYASAVLASATNTPERSRSPQSNTQKRKIEESKSKSLENSPTPPAKKATLTTSVTKDNVIYKDIFRDVPQSKKTDKVISDSQKYASNSKNLESEKTAAVKPVNNVASLQKPVKVKQKVPFSKIMDNVVLVLSGFVNPLRSELRDKALEMGAKYKGDWGRSCTHLICAFMNTPKYTQVKNLNGKIVSKEWILDCYEKKDKIPWTKYIMGKSHQDDSSDGSHYSMEEESESSEEESEFSEEESESSGEEKYFDKRKLNKPKFVRKKKQTNPSDSSNKKRQPSTPKNKTAAINKNSDTPTSKSDSISTNSKGIFRNSPQGNKASNNSGKDESETEDEEALQDYMANTDVDDDSGGDTEEEIRKVEMAQKNGRSPSKKIKNSKEDSEFVEKPDITNLPLPELPNLFKEKRFFLFGHFSSSKRHDMERFIIAYNGIIENYMNNKVKYVITEAKWDSNFEDALNENEDLIFAKPTWIYKCHEVGKLVPFQPYIVIPDS